MVRQVNSKRELDQELQKAGNKLVRVFTSSFLAHVVPLALKLNH
jgi:hypothetical protein